MRILGLIPARGGSKGVPRKNLRVIAGKPLIAWSIEAALRSERLSKVVVSTDDDEIAEIALSWGADVPFKRPAALAMDETPAMDVVIHALHQLPGHDVVTLLQPTSPLRVTDDIDGCVDLFQTSGAPAAVSVVEAALHPLWMYRISSEGCIVPVMDAPAPPTRQQLPAVYALNGAVYVARCERLFKKRSFVGPETAAYVMPTDRSIDIDTPLDWEIAELLLSKRN